MSLQTSPRVLRLQAVPVLRVSLVMLVSLVILVFLVILGAPSSWAQVAPSDPFYAPPLGSEDQQRLPHPLEGKIWDAQAGRFLVASQLIDRLVESDILVIGERHGLELHQQREAFILAALADRGRYPRVVLEMLDPERFAALELYRREHPEYSAGLGAALQWWDSGWPDWRFYAPVFDVAFKAKLPLAAGDLSQEDQEAAKTRFAGERTPRKIQRSPGFQHWHAATEASHCGLIEADRLEILARLQMARDQAMADAVLSDAGPSDAGPSHVSNPGDGMGNGLVSGPMQVLITGSSHSRKDAAVPLYISQASSARLVSLALVEVQEGKAKAQDYLAAPGAQDFLWFTAPALKPSPCQRLRAWQDVAPD